MREPAWVGKSVVIALHDEQLAEHGGRAGLLDEALLDAALNRPKNRFARGRPDLFDLAAAYAFAIAKNHPFVDGNKRASLVVSEGFLLLNGYEVTASEPAKVSIWLSLASGSMSEAEMARWFRDHTRQVS